MSSQRKYLFAGVPRLAALVIAAGCSGAKRTYEELLGENSPIGLSAQQIRFKLDERGAILKSEAMLTAAWVNQSLVFDGPFLVMIQRDSASQPYFALWVGNAELLAPFHETPSKTSPSVK